LSVEEKQVLEILTSDPVHVDLLVRQLKMESAKLLSLLLQMELKNIVKQTPGNLFSKCEEY